MKTFLVYMTCLFILVQGAGAQTEGDKLKQENTQLKQQVHQLQQERDYLKEALSLRQRPMESTMGDVHIRLTSVRGNMGNSEIVIQGLVTYRGAGKQNLQFASSELVSPMGSLYAAHSAGLINQPANTFSVRPAEPDIPYAFSMRFKDVGEKMPTINLLRLQMYGVSGGTVAFSFKGVDVQWED